MEIRKVIHRSNRPIKLPLQTTAIIYLLLDKFNASDFIMGAIYVILFLMWILAAVLIYKQEELPEFK